MLPQHTEEELLEIRSKMVREIEAKRLSSNPLPEGTPPVQFSVLDLVKDLDENPVGTERQG